ncbi:MAG: DUF401 family protein [Chloroflexota bacterium]|jgi:integral membrane protein (TIGR00529 family)
MLSYVLLIAAASLSFATGHDIGQTATYFLEGALAQATLQLLGVVTIIEMLTIFLQDTGSLDRILTALRRVISDVRLLIAMVPSLLGLFPVPGGTVLSAPMVAAYGKELNLSSDHNAAINLFFRHVCDQVFPYKPHLILAAAVLNVPLFTLIGWQLPVAIIGLFFGYWYLIGRLPSPKTAPPVNAADGGNGLPLWVELMPFLIPLALPIGFGIDFLYAMAGGLLFGMITQRVSGSMIRKMVLKGIQLKMLLILVSVMVFKTVVENTGLVQVMAAAFTNFGISLAILVLALPAVVGFFTGLETAVVAMVFPLLFGLIPQGVNPMPYILVMMMSNAVGSCVSPAHTCMVAGNEYLGANYGQVARLTVVPLLFRLVAMIGFAWAVSTYLPL